MKKLDGMLWVTIGEPNVLLDRSRDRPLRAAKGRETTKRVPEDPEVSLLEAKLNFIDRDLVELLSNRAGGTVPVSRL